jgi:hypothetical protein
MENGKLKIARCRAKKGISFSPLGKRGFFWCGNVSVGKTDEITYKSVGKADFFVFLPLEKRTNYD